LDREFSTVHDDGDPKELLPRRRIWVPLSDPGPRHRVRGIRQARNDGRLLGGRHRLGYSETRVSQINPADVFARHHGAIYR